jgi:phage pi2 protein 07
MSIYSFLSVGRFCGVENGQAIVCFGPEKSYNKSHLERKEIRKFLEETLKKLAGVPLKMKLIIEAGSSPALSQPPKASSPVKKADSGQSADDKLLEEAMNNPIVKKTVELFKGKIVYVSG